MMRTSRMRSTAAVLFVSLLASTCASLSEAAPVTFRFDAVVDPPNNVSPFDVPFDVPFAFNEGDVIRGTITFEPYDAPDDTTYTEVIQSFEAAVVIDSHTLRTATYLVKASNNEFALDGPEATYDEIRLSCGAVAGSGPTCNPNSLPGSDNVLWSFNIGLQGASDALTGADIPSDVTDWNELTFSRSLWMSFREKDGPGIRRLTASISGFEVIPEPTALVLAALGYIAALSMIREERPTKDAAA